MQPFASPGLPARAALTPDGLRLAVADISTRELVDAFLQDTVARVAATQALVHVPRAVLGRLPAAAEPAGVIFHVARCGSTLVSQLLKQQPGLVVYSEPLCINELIVPPHAAERAVLVASLRTVAAHFAAHAAGPYVLKLSSWNTLYASIVAEAFPHTPWALCVRDPVEVCVSLLAQAPGWLRGSHPALSAALLGVGSPPPKGPEERVARVYARFCEAAGGLDLARGLLIPYEGLPAAVWETLAGHFGLASSEPTRQAMASAARTHSKSRPGRENAFVPDEERKRAAASPALHRAVDAIARPALERLAGRFARQDFL